MDHSTVTIDSYNSSAARYAEKFMNFTSYREKILRFQQDYLDKAFDILDIGCGPGNTAKLLCEQNSAYRIAGIDLSQEMIALAQQHVPSAEFQQGDIRELSLHKTFDAVIASFCIVHLKNDETEKLIADTGKHLKSGGHLYLSFMEGKTAGLERTSFSEAPIFFNLTITGESSSKSFLKLRTSRCWKFWKTPTPKMTAARLPMSLSLRKSNVSGTPRRRCFTSSIEVVLCQSLTDR